MAALDFSKLVFEELEDHHPVAEFDCGDNEMNMFLRDHALEAQNVLLSKTTVILYEGKIVAYVTLSTDSLRLEDLNNPTKRVLRERFGGKSEFPAVKWECLAVQQEYQKHGLGKYLFKWVVGLVLDTAIGVRFLVLAAKAEKTKIYERWGFVHNQRPNYRRGENHMRLDLIRI